MIHSEMPRQAAGLLCGFQLRISLAAAEKMFDPAYQEFSPQAIPEVTDGPVRVRLLAGGYGARGGVIEGPYTELLRVAQAAGAGLKLPLAGAYPAFVYRHEGSAKSGDGDLPPHGLAVLGAGDEIRVAAGADGTHFSCVAGLPIGEPVEQSGPFV